MKAKKFLALCLTALLVLAALPSPALAAGSTTATQSADTLYSLGQFSGTGLDKDGQPVYELDRAAGRAEAVVMLIRLLGKEQDAINAKAKHPFKDVPKWADPYVGYAYANKLTYGVGGNKFGTNTTASANMYITFVLRALGYNDTGAGASYSYKNAAQYAEQIGLTDHVYSDSNFLRGDIADVSLAALSQNMNGKDTTLIQSLVDAGSVMPENAVAAGFQVDASKAPITTVSIPVKVDGRNYEFKVSDIKKAFPNARAISDFFYDWSGHVNIVRGQSFEDYMRFSFMNFSSVDEYLLSYMRMGEIYSIVKDYTEFENRTTVSGYDWQFEQGSTDPHVYILDNNRNVIGTYLSHTSTAFTFKKTFIDTASLLKKAQERFDETLANNHSVTVSVDFAHPGSSWDDGTGIARHYPVYIDGREMVASDRLVWRALENGGNRMDEILMDHYILFFGRGDNRGTSDGWFSELSDEQQDSYNGYYDKTAGKRRYGLYVGDKVLNKYPILVCIYDRSGNMLGYTVTGPKA